MVKRLADVANGSNEMKSREHLQAVVDITNHALKREAEKDAYDSAYESCSDEDLDD